VTGFLEKPPAPPDATGTCLASMGLYVFTTGPLVQALTEDAGRGGSKHDFGRDILPDFAAAGLLYAYDFSRNVIPAESEVERGYWRDVGTLDAYWQASADLISVTPAFNLYNPDWPIYSAFFPRPAAKFLLTHKGPNPLSIA